MTTESASAWRFVRFGLIVTGQGEREFLPKLFRSLAASGHCHFRVLRQIGQRSPITSERRRLKMTGSGRELPDRDERDISFPVRSALRDGGIDFVVLVDDLERARRDQAAAVFQRYRQALDLLLSDDEPRRVSVHFLVMMLEAYYFGDAATLNAVLGTNRADYAGDVESIEHPKNELKRLAQAIGRSFDERADGDEIVGRLDLAHVLSRPETCASLRTLVAWCVKAIAAPIEDRYALAEGSTSAVTRQQLDAL